ncbi:MAG: hypothetical protein IT305_12870, partial [Chloroflexi bacterium]|nr:hypothetical protein [Chloroflexota bacterium]
GWVKASDLRPGDRVHRAFGGTGPVTSVTVARQPQVMYNLTVDAAHTFFVGDDAWLVHNCIDPGMLAKARAARDAIGEKMKWKATVNGGYDRKTGKVAGGCNKNPIGCAEDDVDRQLGGNPADHVHTESIRPRTGNQVPICHNCPRTHSPSQYPSGTRVEPGGPWGIDVVP